MADDGMLLNFELGSAPIKSQVKFKGGRWRDRVRAQNSAKRNSARQLKKPGGTGDGEADERPAGRPPKRQRVDGNDSTRESYGEDNERRPVTHSTHAGGKPGQVTSRLFTSNPTPTTIFEEKPVAEEGESSQPSNAPLSEEAENFLALGLSRRVAQHLSSKLEMRAPTAIQKNTIPRLAKEDSDAFLQAETGSGKTLAYLLPIVHRIMALSQTPDGASTGTQVHRDSGLFAIVLAPTRELCKQIATVLDKVLRCAPWIVSTTVIGGESKKAEKARLRKGVNILIATPGRLTDHLDNTKVLDVGTVRWLVLDEGDRMMEMGFEEDLRTIVSKIRKDELRKANNQGVVLDGVLPSRRVTVLCSATMKMNVQKLGEISLQDAVHITAATPDGESDGKDSAINEAIFAAPSQLKQSYLISPAKLRLVTLIALLKSTFARRGSVMKAIIFISCADSVNFHFDLLKATPPNAAESTSSSSASPPKPQESSSSPPLSAEASVSPASYITSPANPTVTIHKLHGSLPQQVRTSTLHAFAVSKDPAVLITTDISSRGLDVPAVDLVIEYDPAFAAPDHLHRVGRTARAGRAGKAVLFLMPGCEEGYVDYLHSSTTSASASVSPAVQSYDAILQKGLATPVQLPPSPYPEDHPQLDRQSYTARAEALQLHLEQRLLAKTAPPPPPPEDPDTEQRDAKASAAGGRGTRRRGPVHHHHHYHHQPPKDSPLLEAGRLAFRSHVRAYATHVREERSYFDITQLHLGHLAKAFGLREAPGGIGAGVSRRAHKGRQGKKKAGDGNSGVRDYSRDDDDDDDDAGVGRLASANTSGGGDDEVAKKMREKMKMVMSASSEFNIG